MKGDQLKPAPFGITPNLVARVLESSGRPARGEAHVPLLPTRLVDQVAGTATAPGREVEVAQAAKRKRLAVIRVAAEALSVREASARTARVRLGYPTQRAATALPKLSAETRLRQLQEAIAFLKHQGILVSIYDRDALVRRYRVTGKRENYLADDVVAYAIERGFSPEPQAVARDERDAQERVRRESGGKDGEAHAQG